MEVREPSARYLAKLEYKQTEVGVIPEDWDSVSAGDACVKIQDGTHFSPKTGGTDYLYVTSKNIRFGYLDLSNAESIDAIQHEAIFRRCDVKHGDLLLTKDGANTGNAAINTVQEEFSLLSSVAFLRFDPKRYSAGYFLQQVLSHSGQRRIQDAMSGNAITRLTLEKIRNLRFPVPPTIVEQQAIAEALSDADALIESLDQLLAKKRQIKQGAMQELLTGKKRLPGFSGEWKLETLGELAVFLKGKGLPKSDIVITGGYPCIHYGELFTHYGEVIDSVTSSTKQIECAVMSNLNDVLMPTSDVTPRGLAKASCLRLPDVVIGGDVLVIRPNQSDLHGSFLAYTIRREEDQILRLVSGTTVFHLYASDMRRFKFPCPPTVAEQEAIATVLSDLDAEITALEARLAKARLLKQGMMQELLTGRIRLV